MSIAGTGCIGPPDSDVVVLGRLYPDGPSGLTGSLGQFKAFPADDGSWSALFVVTHRGFGEGEVTPGSYEFRADCGIATTDEIGNVVPAEPYLLTSVGPFEVLAGGPLPTLSVAATTVPITDGRADVVASGDLCVRPDGPSTGEVALWGPIGADPNDPTAVYSAAGDFTAAADGTWSLLLEPVMTPTGPMVPKPGTYSVTAVCWLGDEGFETPNGFGYDSLTVTLVAPAPTTAPDTTPRFTG